MGTINPRARGGASLSGELRASRDDRQQIRRLLSAPPKPKVTPPASGGVIGMAEVRSTGGVSWLAGNSEMSYDGVTYGAPIDVNAGSPGESSIAVSSWLTVEGHQLFVTPGWYIPVLSMTAFWFDVTAAPPAFGGPYMYGGFDSAHNDNGIHARVPFDTGGGGGFQQVVSYGPTYIHEGSDFHAELRSAGGPPTADNAVSPTRSFVVWNITKLS